MGPRLSCLCCGLHRNTTILHPIPSYPVLPLSWHGLAVTVDRSPGAPVHPQPPHKVKVPTCTGHCPAGPGPWGDPWVLPEGGMATSSSWCFQVRECWTRKVGALTGG